MAPEPDDAVDVEATEDVDDRLEELPMEIEMVSPAFRDRSSGFDADPLLAGVDFAGCCCLTDSASDMMIRADVL